MRFALVEDQIRLSVNSENLEKNYTIKPGDLVVLQGGDGFSRRSLLWELNSIDNLSEWKIQLSDIDWRLVPKNWKKEEVVLVDRSSVFDISRANNIFLEKQPSRSTTLMPYLARLPQFLMRIYENLSLDDEQDWADDPKIRLHISLMRSILSDSKIILIDHLFDELSAAQQREFLIFFKQNLRQKILIVNSCSESLSEYWTQEIKWKIE